MLTFFNLIEVILLSLLCASYLCFITDVEHIIVFIFYFFGCAVVLYIIKLIFILYDLRVYARRFKYSKEKYDELLLEDEKDKIKKLNKKNKITALFSNSKEKNDNIDTL